MKTEAMDIKENKKGYMGGFGGRKGKGKLMQLLYNLKK